MTTAVAGIDTAGQGPNEVSADSREGGPRILASETVRPSERKLAVTQPVLPGPTPAVDLGGMLEAEIVPIGRREVQPGRREVVLLDAFRSKDWVWLRFAVRGGARDRVDGLWLGKDRLVSYLAEQSGGDLRLVVQVRRALLSSKSKVTLSVGGGEYRFAVRSGTVGALLGSLFH